ncbi:MAG: ribonuclease H [Patescibacteria group bacterium]
MTSENKIEIYTDGSCLGNPGPGGWGAIIFHNNEKIILSGNDKATTNNRMEMMGMIGALQWLHENPQLKDHLQNQKIIFYSDSNLLIQTLNQGWKRKANLDLWAKIDKHRAWLDINWTWVKAHAKNKFNNEVDVIAVSESRKLVSDKDI